MYRFALLFLLVTLSLSPRLNAQFAKGMRMPGVSVGSAFFNSGTIDYSAASPTNGYTSNSNSLGLNLAPSMGWFISNTTVVGGRFTGGYTYDKYIDEVLNITFRKKENKTLTLGLGVFARNYFNTSGSFIPFCQLSVDGGTGSSGTEGFSYASSYKEIFDGKSSGDFFANGGLSLGVTKMLNDHIGIDLSAGYTYSYSKNTFKLEGRMDTDLDGVYDTYSISEVASKIRNHGLTISGGIQVFLSARK